MRYILIMIFLIMMVGCKNVKNVDNQPTQYYIDNSMINLVTIDSCQYLFGNWGYRTILTHKGNCPNHTYNASTIDTVYIHDTVYTSKHYDNVDKVIIGK